MRLFLRAMKKSDPLAPSLAGWELVERAGEGASAVVWRARDRTSKVWAALKIAKGDKLHDRAIAERVPRRWGPELLDAGRTGEGRPYVATAWLEGATLEPRKLKGDRDATAAVVAHAVGRALAELHEGSVRHGDVKPANVIMHEGAPRRDVAAERGATLIDLSLAERIGADARGMTPRYAAPEIARGDAGPEADLFALGVVLAEVLDREVAKSDDPVGAALRAARAKENAAREPWRWVVALLAEAPGGRPAASWIADRASRYLKLTTSHDEEVRAREMRIERAFVAAHREDVRSGDRVGSWPAGTARAWLEKAIAWRDRIDADAAEIASDREIASLGAIARARMIVTLVGAHAASWPIAMDDEGDDAFVAKLCALAKVAEPEAWTLEELRRGRATRASEANDARAEEDDASRDDRVARLAMELSRANPEMRAMATVEDLVATGRAPRSLVVMLVRVLARRGDTGRAWAALASVEGDDVIALRAEIARRRGDRATAAREAKRGAASHDPRVASAARATWARLAWDEGAIDVAIERLADAGFAAGAEMRALIAIARGAYDDAAKIAREAAAGEDDDIARARLEATCGLAEHGRGDARASLDAFGRAAALAVRAGALIEEATYVTGEAAAATDVGAIGRALAAATRAALLWERLGSRGQAARAWLSRASALATIGATHAADEAAREARARAAEVRDARAAAYARWARVESRVPGDDVAREEAIAADRELVEATLDDRVRAAARLLVWARDAIDDARIAETDRLARRDDVSSAARWEWWGARAHARTGDAESRTSDAEVLAALRVLIDTPAPLSSRGPALASATALARERGDGDSARRFENARRAAAKTLHDETPPAYRTTLASVAWARTTASIAHDVPLSPAQVGELDAIVRALGTRDRLRPLLEQVIDTMVLWTGVERGLLLMKAPNDRLVPRAARNLARRDLKGEQLALSQSIARRAIESGDALVATDAMTTLGDLHASVHALRLRSVLAVPLIARGETFGVVYLDDRVRRGAFGAEELAWVRLLASQAAMAIADARDQVLLRRVARRATRAREEALSRLHDRENELTATRAELRSVRSDGYDAICGRSEPMRALLKLTDRVSASDIPVLVVGESGTGKELIARAIHTKGSRARAPFVSENCGAVPEALLESTLFGHVRGAFTGASSTRAGLFDVADGGTLFLDEIGEMPLTMQTKLLRVLEDGEVRAIGSERTRHVDVRVIGATNRDLQAMVARGTFREDLFYRLNVIAIHVPALRERTDDIPLLVEHFLAKHAPDLARARALRVTRAAMDKLLAYAWPGNVRQLENEIRRAIVLADDRIDVTDFSPEITRSGTSASRASGQGLKARVDALEAELVREALVKTGGNQTRAAELLGLSRFGLQKMMKRLRVSS